MYEEQRVIKLVEIVSVEEKRIWRKRGVTPTKEGNVLPTCTCT